MPRAMSNAGKVRQLMRRLGEDARGGGRVYLVFRGRVAATVELAARSPRAP